MNFSSYTLGCKVNQYETEVISQLLTENGWNYTSIDKSDYLIINSCAVTENAVKKLKKYIRSAILKNNNIKIIVLGCAIDYDKNIKNYRKNIVQTISNNNKTVDYVSKILNLTNSTFLLNKPMQRSRAFIKIQEGCNNFCSYCIIPYLRKKIYSRNINNIIKEIKSIINNGYKEIVLCGINIGLYKNLIDLLKKIISIKKDFRIRISSINVNDISSELIDLMAESDKICNHLHISLQSGSDKILKSMNRKYTSKDFIDKVLYIKNKIPDIAITTDIIVGFHKESDKDFIDTVNMIKKIEFSRCHIFPYSIRPKTKAETFKNIVPNYIKSKRCKILKETAKLFTDKFYKNNKGKKHKILVETIKNDEFSGYTDNYLKVTLPLKNKKIKINDFIEVVL